MQEVSVGTPRGKGQQVARLALKQGITEASVSQVRVYENGSSKEKEEVKMEVAAPDAARFIEALMAAPFFDPQEYSIVSDEVLAIVSSEPPEQVARPMRLNSVTILSVSLVVYVALRYRRENIRDYVEVTRASQQA